MLSGSDQEWMRRLKERERRRSRHAAERPEKRAERRRRSASMIVDTIWNIAKRRRRRRVPTMKSTPWRSVRAIRFAS
jgi:hypothetical protein